MGLELCLEGGGHRVQVDEGDGEGGPAHDQGHQAVGGGVDGGQLEQACKVLLESGRPRPEVTPAHLRCSC